ncbi:MAG TPA: PDZ domain-containing protein [Alphaproteobacteria bacterium]|nr:PDZ domain-containing protein [Alphaproteobacteria bacterium]
MILFFRLMAGVFIAALSGFSLYAFFEIQTLQKSLQSHSQQIDVLSQKMLSVETRTELLDVRNEEAYIKTSFGGIGLQFNLVGVDAISEKGLRIESAVKDKPAWRAGLRSGDFILTIDEQNTAGMKIGDALNKMRGQAGTLVSITYKSLASEEPKSVAIVRENIKIRTLRPKKNDDKIDALWEIVE